MKSGGVPWSEVRSWCRGHWARADRSALGRREVGPLASYPFAPLLPPERPQAQPPPLLHLLHLRPWVA